MTLELSILPGLQDVRIIPRPLPPTQKRAASVSKPICEINGWCKHVGYVPKRHKACNSTTSTKMNLGETSFFKVNGGSSANHDGPATTYPVGGTRHMSDKVQVKPPNRDPTRSSKLAIPETRSTATFDTQTAQEAIFAQAVPSRASNMSRISSDYASSVQTYQRWSACDQHLVLNVTPPPPRIPRTGSQFTCWPTAHAGRRFGNLPGPRMNVEARSSRTYSDNFHWRSGRPGFAPPRYNHVQGRRNNNPYVATGFGNPERAQPNFWNGRGRGIIGPPVVIEESWPTIRERLDRPVIGPQTSAGRGRGNVVLPHQRENRFFENFTPNTRSDTGRSVRQGIWGAGSSQQPHGPGWSQGVLSPMRRIENHLRKTENQALRW
ncbi:hypothetical protein IWX49DRAFT_389702 [Phyllosticta citricarpa]|uniref:Uncharacterized protein n=1 Tax=Phyllosticta paracitricarpa TaxID=2016321 RepID=A0ABR1NE58_9PEZI